MNARLALAALVLSACDTVQDIVPGGVCSWVERAPEYEDCTAIRTSSDGSVETVEYDEFGLVAAESVDGMLLVATTRDSRGREVASETPGLDPYASLTTEWSSCTAGVESGTFDGETRETVFELRDGEFASYTRTYGSGRISTLETEWSGGRLRSEEVREDGVVSRTSSYEYESLPGGGTRQTRTSLYTEDGTVGVEVLELDREDRTTRVELTFDGDVYVDARFTYSDDVTLEELDWDGDGVYEEVTTITLDDDGRPIQEVTRRNGDIREEVTIAWACP